MRWNGTLLSLWIAVASAPVCASTIDFDGYIFSNDGFINATVNPDSSLTLSLVPGEPRIASIDLFSNANFAAMTYVDNVNINISLVIGCCAGLGVHPPIALIQSGSESTYAGRGRVSYSFGLNPLSSSLVYSVPGRVDGAVHTVSNYERLDGTVEQTFDGATFGSTFLKDNGAIEGINIIYIQLENLNPGSNPSVTIQRFSTASITSDVPEPASFVLLAGVCLTAGPLIFRRHFLNAIHHNHREGHLPRLQFQTQRLHRSED